MVTTAQIRQEQVSFLCNQNALKCVSTLTASAMTVSITSEFLIFKCRNITINS
jgi:hypothetical protein